MDAKSSHRRIIMAQRCIQLAERFADDGRYLAFHPSALRNAQAPALDKPLTVLPSLLRTTLEAQQGANSENPSPPKRRA